MKKKVTRLTAVLVVISFAIAIISAGFSSKPVYVLSTNPAVTIEPIATSGDVLSGLTVRGIPDGMGAFKNDRGGITILSNHEVAINDKVALLSASNSNDLIQNYLNGSFIDYGTLNIQYVSPFDDYQNSTSGTLDISSDSYKINQ